MIFKHQVNRVQQFHFVFIGEIFWLHRNATKETAKNTSKRICVCILHSIRLFAVDLISIHPSIALLFFLSLFNSFRLIRIV